MTHTIQHGLIPILTVLIFLSACSHKPSRYSQRHDSAPDNPVAVDVSQIPDAEPRDEPRSRYGNPVSYKVFGKTYYTLKSSKDYVERGIASWYGKKFHGHRTSSGETYDMHAMTAAHKTLPLPTYARVTNLDNNRSVVVKINDRGPFHGDRLIDLSYTAATKLGIVASGTGRVEVRALDTRRSEPYIQTVKTPTTTHTTKVTTVPANTTLAKTTTLTPLIYLQLGSFSKANNAVRLQKKLTDSEFQGVHVMEAVAHDKTVYRVRIGPLDSKESATTLTNMLEPYGVVSPRVVID